MPLTKFMINSASSYVVTGSRAKKYLIGLGAKSKKIFIGYSTVDINYFRTKSKISKSEINRLKRKLNIDLKDKVVMFNGQLIQRKGIYDLIDAFKKLLETHSSTSLLLVGYGQEYENIKKVLGNSSLSTKVIMTGFVQNNKLPKYYALADVFVLPSREETWGLVVNEAMACGCPVIVGNRVGSSADLVKQGVNGLVFKSGDVEDLYQTLYKMISNDKQRKMMAASARKDINNFGLENIVIAIRSAVGAVVN